MARTTVAKRLVFHIGGYDPTMPPAGAQRRFVREMGRFQRTWLVKAFIDGLRDSTDQIKWKVTTTGPNWQVETGYHLVRWDDVIESFKQRPIWFRIPQGILAFVDFVAAGALWGYLRTNWHYAGFFLYPFVAFGLLVLAAFLVGEFAFKIGASICCHRHRSPRIRNSSGWSMALAAPGRPFRRLDFLSRVYSEW